ncbi:MAG: VIT1/CCC1 transporter family protein [Candidatus Heimdallarchaeota archaeon]
MPKIFDKLKQYIYLTDTGQLCQRYFVIGAFDGALTVLGMVLASYFAGSLSPSFIIPAAIGATIALGLSSAWGAYEAERVVQRQELFRLEKAVMRSMENTLHEKASQFAVIWGAFVHGFAPVPAALLPVLSFLMVPPLSIKAAFQISVGVTMTFLFFLGVFLAKIGKLNKWTTGVRLVFAGIITALFCLVIGAVAH